MTRTHLELAGLALLALLGATTCYQTVTKAAATARAEVAQHRADSLYAVAEARESARAAEQARAEARIREAEARRDSADARAERAASRRPEVVREARERIIVVAGDAPGVVEAVDSALAEIEAVHEEETTALRILAEEERRIGLQWRMRAEAAERVNADLRLALEASRAEADEWESAANPGLFGISIGPGTGFAVGALAGAVAALALVR